jgi:hypothetical protein
MTSTVEPDAVARKIAARLAEAGIAYEVAENGRLHVPLPDGFGTFEIGACGDAAETICGLVGHPWHTHGDQFGGIGIDDQCADLAELVIKVLAGTYHLIEEVSPDGESRKSVESNLVAYLKFLPDGTTYSICNHPPTVY